jgi:flavin-dependent dehydrogenase
VAAEAVRAGNCSARFLARYERRWRAKHGRNLRIAAAINRRIARWDDAKWSARTEILKAMSSSEFARALASQFSASWALRMLWRRPTALLASLQ